MVLVWLNAPAPLGVGDAGGEERGDEDDIENVSHERPPWRRASERTATGLGSGVKTHLRYSRIWVANDWVGTPLRRLGVGELAT